jgi:hypothetical protein
MKKIAISLIIMCIATISSCGLKQGESKVDIGTSDSLKNVSSTETIDTTLQAIEVQTLVRKMLNWARFEHPVQLHPWLTDENDSIVIGFDQEIIRKNISILESTGLFSKEFIDNYKNINTTLDKKIRKGEYGEIYSNEIPIYNFASDVNPWTLCQDVPYDKPNPYDYVEVRIIKLDGNYGEFDWKWGRLGLNVAPDWRSFSYRFKVRFEDGKWKISYLEGFDYKKIFDDKNNAR